MRAVTHQKIRAQRRLELEQARLDRKQSKARGPIRPAFGDPKLFAGGGSAAQKVRHVADSNVARPAQLQLARAQFINPDALAVSTKPALEHKSPARVAFDKIPHPAVNGDVRLLEHNVESWCSAWNILSDAPKDGSYFILERDIFGMSFLGAFLRQARKGQPVRLMVDAQGDTFGRVGFTLSFRGQDYLQELVNTENAQIKVYNPLHKKVFRPFSKRVGKFGTFASNHDKLLRSATLGMTGGRNISKNYFVDPKDLPDVYRDTDVLVRGKAASGELKKVFEREFDNEAAHFQIYSEMLGNIRRRDAELIGAYHMMDAWMNAAEPLPAMFSEEDKARLRSDKSFRNAMADRLVEVAKAGIAEEGVESPGFLQARALRRLARELAGYPELHGKSKSFDIEEGMHNNVGLKVLDRTSAATNQVSEIASAFDALTHGARKKIIIQNPYVVLTKDALAKLEDASRRGVPIELYTNSPDSSDSVLTQAFFLEDWPRLLAKLPTLRIFAFTGEQKLHGKSAQADDEIGLASSYNLDLLSEQVNGEVAIIADSPELAKDLRKSFEADKANPLHKVVEYAIEKDTQGRPVLDDRGEPIVRFGAKNHVSKMKWLQFQALRWIVRQVRKAPMLSDIRGPEAPARALAAQN